MSLAKEISPATGTVLGVSVLPATGEDTVFRYIVLGVIALSVVVLVTAVMRLVVKAIYRA